MVKLTHVQGAHAHFPALVLIPGGPGLSSMTLRSLEVLKRSFNLYFVDMPGTGGISYDRDLSFEELTVALRARVMKLSGPVFVAGHSFGGFFASHLALRTPSVVGLACISTPFGSRSLGAAADNYKKKQSTALLAAEGRWKQRPSDSNLAEWLAEYGDLYFSESKGSEGREFLKRDACSHRLFLSIRSDAAEMEALLPRLKGWDGKKLFIAGEDDALLPADLLEAESDRGGFSFCRVPGASHFVMFDQPEFVAGLIEGEFAAGTRRST